MAATSRASASFWTSRRKARRRCANSAASRFRRKPSLPRSKWTRISLVREGRQRNPSLVLSARLYAHAQKRYDARALRKAALAQTVALIDYGSGNLRSAEKALAHAAGDSGTGHEIVVTADPDAVAGAERIVLPGVGAFADCMRGLSAIPGMIGALEDSVVKRGTPFLGICVGMQLLADVGREH